MHHKEMAALRKLASAKADIIYRDFPALSIKTCKGDYSFVMVSYSSSRADKNGKKYMAGRATLMEDPMKGVMKELNVATTKVARRIPVSSMEISPETKLSRRGFQCS